MDEGITFQRLKFRLNFDIIADFLHNGGERVANFIVLHLGVPSLLHWRECNRLKGSPQGHIDGVFSGSRP